MYINHRISLTYSQSMKIWSLDFSPCQHRIHTLGPFHPFFLKLFHVNIAFFRTSHIKACILCGALFFHKIFVSLSFIPLKAIILNKRPSCIYRSCPISIKICLVYQKLGNACLPTPLVFLIDLLWLGCSRTPIGAGIYP